MNETEGHVFVVLGKIESVVHDVALIPTSDAFEFRDYWKPLGIGRSPQPLRPEIWPGIGFAPSHGLKHLWFLSVGSAVKLEVAALVERVVGAVESIAASDPPTAAGRVRPLLAMPVIGIEGGGHGGSRGVLIGKMLPALRTVASNRGIDIALVTPERTVFSAIQHLRGEQFRDSLSPDLLTAAEKLGNRALKGELALFIGAGVSIPAGLPTWKAMLEELSGMVQATQPVSFGRLNVLDQAQLIERRLPKFYDKVAEIVLRHKRPSLSHALLAGLHCREVVTTNYDQLYETAADATSAPPITVLPGQHQPERRDWILKLHGDVGAPKSIVLTRRHFVKFDANEKPSGSLLQSLLVTRHLLMVGVSLDDDNVVRLVHEVQAYRSEHEITGDFGTLLDVAGDAARGELWQGQLEWLTMPGTSIEQTSHLLEIFLDAVSYFAADKSAWILDERFDGLLDKHDQDLAESARKLRQRLSTDDPSWKKLVEVLDGLGAQAGKSAEQAGTAGA